MFVQVSQNWGKITDPIGNIIALKENITELTSAMSEAELLQTALKAVADLNKPTNMPMIHSGFKTAYSGVRGALIDVIAAATGVKGAYFVKIIELGSCISYLTHYF